MPLKIEQVIAINRLASVVRTNTLPRVASSSNVEVPVREFKIEENPSVGIFWYDSGLHSLFGVRKQEVTPFQIETAACDGLPFIILEGAGPSGAHKASRAALHPPSAQRRLSSGHCRTLRGRALRHVPPRFPSRKDGPYDPAPPRPRPHTVQSTYILPPHSSQSAHAGTRQGLPCRPDTSVDSL